MSLRPTPQILQMLIERKPMALAKAAECEAKNQSGMALYWRVLAADASALYAYMIGDDGQYVLSEVENKQLLGSIRQMDEQMLGYRVMMARTTLNKEAA